MVRRLDVYEDCYMSEQEDGEYVRFSDYDALAARLIEVLEAIGDPYNELDHAVLDRLLRDLGPDFCDTTRWWARLSAKKSGTPPAAPAISDKQASS
jgi:hypothetical protein